MQSGVLTLKHTTWDSKDASFHQLMGVILWIKCGSEHQTVNRIDRPQLENRSNIMRGEVDGPRSRVSGSPSWKVDIFVDAGTGRFVYLAKVPNGNISIIGRRPEGATIGGHYLYSTVETGGLVESILWASVTHNRQASHRPLVQGFHTIVVSRASLEKINFLGTPL